MKLKISYLIGTLFIINSFLQPLHAGILPQHGITIQPTTSTPADNYLQAGLEAMQRREWQEGIQQFKALNLYYPGTPQAQEGDYYLGIAYYHQSEYDFANDAFSNYLKGSHHPDYFEEAMTYKFQIANKFKSGAKRRFFSTHVMPKWMVDPGLAMQIFDEVVAAIPFHELAVQSLFAKAELQAQMRMYPESVDTYQQLIRRFPKHEMTPRSYVAISKVFQEQCEFEEQNPDILALAQINLRRFQQDFPREERVNEVEHDVQQLKESYARALYETAQFYERTSHPVASAIYYHSAIEQFPDTQVAERCLQRLDSLKSEKKIIPIDPNA